MESKGTSFMSRSILHHLSNMVGAVIMDVHVVASGTGLLVLVDDLTADGNSRMNSEVYRDMPSAQNQSNTATRRRGAVQIKDHQKKKKTAKAT